MNRRRLLLAGGAGALTLCGGWARAQDAARNRRKPNFVWIVSEDNSKHYVKLFDPHGAPMPAVEAMAERGVVFDRAFSNAPVCSAARTTLMTGVYGPRVASHYHRKMALTNLPDGLRMWPYYLRQAGYYTTNNSKKDYNVVEGRDVWDESSKKATWRKRPDNDQPFFHMQSHAQTHESSLHFNAKSVTPENLKTDPASVFVPPYFPDTPLIRHTIARYLDNHQKIDAIVRQTVDALREDGVLEDTFIFYFGDHGGVLPGSKGYAHETGLHVPLVARIPENFRDLCPFERGSRTDAFVSFVDFGPTLLRLAGLERPEQMDGAAFLGGGLSKDAIERRDTTYGYADRFDEKYDFIRTLRDGKWKYCRNYQSYYPDSLQNNYRYKQLAYKEWRDLYEAGKLNATQSAFFEPKPVEELYDLEADPHETRNLAGDAGSRAELHRLRAALRRTATTMPDLSFYPESELIANAVADPVKYGAAHKSEIAKLAEIADWALAPFADAEPKLRAALGATNKWERYWAATTCACFGKSAASLAAPARALLKDAEPTVRVRAAEFLAILGEDPRPALYAVVNNSDDEATQSIALQALAFAQDHLDGFPVDAARLPNKLKGQAGRRLEYLKGKG